MQGHHNRMLIKLTVLQLFHTEQW